jgi:hypothetical protein
MIYMVKFQGHYPVGAVALVRAPDRLFAKRRFFTHLRENEPFLYEKNQKLTVRDFVPIDIMESNVQILWNGDY